MKFYKKNGERTAYFNKNLSEVVEEIKRITKACATNTALLYQLFDKLDIDNSILTEHKRPPKQILYHFRSFFKQISQQEKGTKERIIKEIFEEAGVKCHEEPTISYSCLNFVPDISGEEPGEEFLGRNAEGWNMLLKNPTNFHYCIRFVGDNPYYTKEDPVIVSQSKEFNIEEVNMNTVGFALNITLTLEPKNNLLDINVLNSLISLFNPGELTVSIKKQFIGLIEALTPDFYNLLCSIRNKGYGNYHLSYRNVMEVRVHLLGRIEHHEEKLKAYREALHTLDNDAHKIQDIVLEHSEEYIKVLDHKDKRAVGLAKKFLGDFYRES